MILNPRYYQREAKTAVQKSWAEGSKKTIAQLATGSGKTVIASMLVSALQPERLLFLADQDELTTQPMRSIERFTGLIPGLEKADRYASLEAEVVVGSSQTLTRKGRLNRFPEDHFKYIIIDECHRGTDRDIKIADHFSEARVLGLTATPFRANLADLSRWYDDVAYSLPMMNMIELGFSPPLIVKQLEIEIDLEGVGTSQTTEGKDYDLSGLDSTISLHLIEIAKQIKEVASDRHGIAYLPLVSTSKAFAAALNMAGVVAAHVDGSSPDRKEIIQAFSEGKIQWLCNAGVISVGVDIPICDAILNLVPTKSPSMYQQRVGRAMRVLPGLVDHLTEKNDSEERRFNIALSEKSDVMVFDLLWQHDRLSVMNPASLVAGSEDEVRRMVAKYRELSEADLLEIHRRVQEEKESQLVEAIKRAEIKKANKVKLDIESAAYLLGCLEWLNYEPYKRVELERPTENQLRAIDKFGIDSSQITSKGLAGKLAQTLIGRAKGGYANLNQLKAIRRFNSFSETEIYKNPERLTYAQAKEILDREYAREKHERLAQSTY